MRSMSTSAFITCAITGAGDTVGSSPHVPVTPEQIAESAIEAARRARPSCTSTCATRRPARAPATPSYYREVVERIRASDVDVVINLTAGMGGDLVLGGAEARCLRRHGTDMAGATERLAHVAELMPRSARSTAAR